MDLYKHKERDPKTVLSYLLDFQKKLSPQKLTLLSSPEAKLLDAFLKYKLAQEYQRMQQFPQALAEIKNLNAAYPDYPFRREALFFQAEIEHSLNQDFFPLVFNKMAQELKANPEALESIHKKIYELYEKSSALKQADKKIQLEEEAVPIEPIIQSTLQLLQAQQYLGEAKYKKALSLSLQVQAKVPKHKSAFRFLPNKGWSGLYTNSWRIIEECYQKIG